jgi:diguanylate cyclase (GGDEF)-like protein
VQATEKRILIPADAPRRPEIERALRADGWNACAYSDVRDVESILSGGAADAVVLQCAGNSQADAELVKVVRHLSPGSFVIGVGAEGSGFDTALRRESSPEEVAVAARIGAAMREVREAERRLRERLKTMEEENRVQVERIRDLEGQCTTLETWAHAAQELAVHDELTGLYNRRHFVQAADAELERARRKGAIFALAMVDIDRFKHYNDTYGHPTGDLILKQFARVLIHSLRKMDTVARYGGEEFVLLLPETAGVNDGFDPVRLIERLREAIEKDGLLNGRNRIKAPITISAGVVKYPEDGETIADLIREADARLFRAKSAGRNRVCWSRDD